MVVFGRGPDLLRCTPFPEKRLLKFEGVPIVFVSQTPISTYVASRNWEKSTPTTTNQHQHWHTDRRVWRFGYTWQCHCDWSQAWIILSALRLASTSVSGAEAAFADRATEATILIEVYWPVKWLFCFAVLCKYSCGIYAQAQAFGSKRGRWTFILPFFSRTSCFVPVPTTNVPVVLTAESPVF